MPELNWLPRSATWSQKLDEFSRHSTAEWTDLVALANENLDFVQTAKLDKRFLKAFAEAPQTHGTRPVKLAVLGSSTMDQLLSGIRVAGLRHNWWTSIFLTPYAQYLQQTLDTSSPLHAFSPNVVLCAFDTQHLIGDETIQLSEDQVEAKIAATIENLRSLWRRLRESFNAQIIQQTLMPTHLALMGNNEQRLPGAGAWMTRRLNTAMRQAADEEGVDILALDEQCEQDGLLAWHDPRLWLRAKQYVSPQAAPAYGENVARLIGARLGLSAKCLVLDLDNTLWGGVIGDDGVEKIVLGQGNGEGEAFASFQRYARDLSKRGIILAVCSKNDEANALLPFTSHPEMVLKREDIACFVANWQDKASNLRSIAQRLNIGLDSLVFVDDNPFERNLVRRELPMVRVPELPDDPAFYGACVSRAGYFEAVSLTPEDRERGHQYQANIERETLRTSGQDLASYLQSLNMVLEWDVFNATDLQRIVQLIGKTNQFNLTTRRHGQDEVLEMMHDPRAVLLHFRLKDSFGDNGIIAIVAALPIADSGDWRIDSWLMSCRVLGREVERATLSVLVSEARKLGAKRLIGEYLPTPKNGMVKDHYRSLGFSLLNEHESATQWVLDLDAFTPHTAAMTIRRA